MDGTLGKGLERELPADSVIEAEPSEAALVLNPKPAIPDSCKSEVARGLQCALLAKPLLKKLWRQNVRLTLVLGVPAAFGNLILGLMLRYDLDLVTWQGAVTVAGLTLAALAPTGVYLWERKRIRIGRFGELDFERAEKKHLLLPRS